MPFVKGYKQSAEHKRRLSESLKGRVVWNKGLKTGYNHAHALAIKGRKASLATREKMRIAATGRKLTEEDKKKVSLSKIGRKFPKLSGRNHWAWIEDRTKLSRISKQGERRTSIYFNWRKEVWKRDQWKCRIASGDCSGKLEAHHILPWRDFPELRYEVNNGITLCYHHHPRKRDEEKRLAPVFQEIVLVTT